MVYLPDEAFECDLQDADDFINDVEEELGEAVAKRIVSLDLEAVLRHGYKLSEYEEEFKADRKNEGGEEADAETNAH